MWLIVLQFDGLAKCCVLIVREQFAGAGFGVEIRRPAHKARRRFFTIFGGLFCSERRLQIELQRTELVLRILSVQFLVRQAVLQAGRLTLFAGRYIRDQSLGVQVTV